MEKDKNLLAIISQVGVVKEEVSDAEIEVHNTLRTHHLHNIIAAAAEDLNDHKTAEHHWHQASLAHSHANAVYKEHLQAKHEANHALLNAAQSYRYDNKAPKSFTHMKRAAKDEAHKTITDKLS